MIFFMGAAAVAGGGGRSRLPRSRSPGICLLSFRPLLSRIQVKLFPDRRHYEEFTMCSGTSV